MGILSSDYPNAQSVEAALDRANRSEADIDWIQKVLPAKANASDVATATANLQNQIDNIINPVTEDAEVENARVGADGTSYLTLKARLDGENEIVNSEIESSNANIIMHNDLEYELSSSDFMSGKYNQDMKPTSDSTYIAIKNPILCNAGDKFIMTTGSFTKKLAIQFFTLDRIYQTTINITNQSFEYTCESNMYVVILGRYDSSTAITPINYDAEVKLITKSGIKFAEIESALSVQEQLIEDIFEDNKQISGYDALNTSTVSNSSEYLIYPYDMSNKVLSKMHINVSTTGTFTIGAIDKQYVVVGSSAASSDKYTTLKAITLNSTGESTVDVDVKIPDNAMLWIKADTDTAVWKFGTDGRDRGFIYNDDGEYKNVSNYSLGIDWYVREPKSEHYVPYVEDSQQGILSKWFKPEQLLIDSDYIPDYVEVAQPFGFVGRWYEKEINAEKCYFTTASGSEIYFKTVGVTQMTLQFVNTTGTNIYYTISIDGSSPQRKLISNNNISLSGSGIHLIRIVTDGMDDSYNKWSGEYGYGFKGVTVNSGTIVGVMPRNPIIAFYGDSITEGLRALGASTGVTDLGDVNSATNAFPYFCCEQLNAISYRCGYGASGITIDGSFHKTIDAINYYAQNVPVDTFYPQMIVLNIGTNDYIHSVSGSTFKTGYIEVVRRLHILYPNANILCMIPFNQYYTTEIAEVVASYGYCKLIETAGWNIAKVDNYHPSAAGALSAGILLAEEIKNLIY